MVEAGVFNGVREEKEDNGEEEEDQRELGLG